MFREPEAGQGLLPVGFEGAGGLFLVGVTFFDEEVEEALGNHG